MRLLLLTMLAALCAAPAYAQDPTQVDSKHYKVEFENDQVRVLRVTYGPGEKSAMHNHPGSVAVFLTDAKVRFGLPDGTSKDAVMKAGSTQWDAGNAHQPQSTSDKKFELILVELKAKPATGK